MNIKVKSIVINIMKSLVKCIVKKIVTYQSKNLKIPFGKKKKVNKKLKMKKKKLKNLKNLLNKYVNYSYQIWKKNKKKNNNCIKINK